MMAKCKHKILTGWTRDGPGVDPWWTRGRTRGGPGASALMGSASLLLQKNKTLEREYSNIQYPPMTNSRSKTSVSASRSSSV